MANSYPDLTGQIFGHIVSGSTVYWKITGPVRGGWYPTVKCTKNGTEFVRRNGFGPDYILRIKVNPVGQKEGWWVGTSSVGENVVSRKGIKIGVKKRRIKWLKDTIEAYTNELNRLEAEIAGK